MSNSNKFSSSTVGKQFKHATTAGAAMHTATILTGTMAGAAFPLAPVIAPVAAASLPVVLGVGVVAYGVSALWDRLFD